MGEIKFLNFEEPEFAVKSLYDDEFFSNSDSLSRNSTLNFIIEAAVQLSNRISEQKRQYKKRFLVISGKNMRSIAIEKIAYFLSDGRYSKIVTHNGEQYLLEQSLASLMKKLDPNLFYRANRQIIVSYQSIKKISIWSKSRVKLDLLPANENDVIVSIDSSGEFKKWLDR